MYEDSELGLMAHFQHFETPSRKNSYFFPGPPRILNTARY